ncbi:MAG: MlaD family protein [Longimicrobiales bacterium]|nr:MlaD family protein [Longimicrobiales bacterium]
MTDFSPNTTTDAEIQANIPRSTGTRYVRLGLFVILGVISFFTVLFLLTDPATFRGRYRLVTTLSDAGGVRSGDPIQMRGVNVGRVSGFAMTQDGRVDIRLEVDDEWRVPEGSTVTLAEAGIFGGRTVKIVPGEGDAWLEPWDTIPGDDGGIGMLESAEALAGDATVVLERIQTLLDDETVSSLQGSVREFEGLGRELREIVAGQRDEIERLTTSLATAAEGLESMREAGPEITATASEARALVSELRETTTQLDGALRSLDTVLGRMARGEGTLGRLSEDPALYDNLITLTAGLDSLITEFRADPGRFVRLSIF